MTDGDLLLKAILANPDDDTPRLVYADYLQEHGDEPRAEFIRVQVALAKWKPRCIAGCHHKDRESWCRRCRLLAREGELFAPHVVATNRAWFRAAGADFPCGLTCDRGAFDYLGSNGLVRRGFLEAVRCPAADWLRHADSLTWHPEQTVECKAKGCEHGTIGRPRPGDVGGQWLGRMCDACDGTGRVPRPVPPTAQPITRVVLTTTPRGHDWWDYGEMLFVIGPTGIRHDRWPGVTFELPR